MNKAGYENLGDGKTEEAASEILIANYPWLANLDSTLTNVEGSQAFESYLTQRGILPLLEFIWACDGMKTLVEENPDKCDQLVSCIFKNYVITGQLFILSNHVVLNIAKRMESHFENPEPVFVYPGQMMENHVKIKELDMGIFDEAKREVEEYLQTTIFPKFIKAIEDGEIYVRNANFYDTQNATKTLECGSNSKPARSKLASHPEAFVRALCEKLEGLQLTRKDS